VAVRGPCRPPPSSPPLPGSKGYRPWWGIQGGNAPLAGSRAEPLPLIYLIAGEPSGDLLGGRLMRALRRRADVAFSGIGGEAMAAEGLVSLFPMRELSLMGLLEVLPRLRDLRRRLGETVADIAAKRPDVVVTIDSPGFSFRVLRAVAPLGIRRVHYVAPQVWAWREGRVKHYPGLWDRLLCLLPFEPAFFARHGLPATFVGHPVLESGCDSGDAARFRARYHLAAEDRVLIVMPGSRPGEVSRHLPLLDATLRQLGSRVLPVIPLADQVADVVRIGTAGWSPSPVLIAESGDKHDAFAAAAAALTKSGTSTLELALAGVPMVVTYRANPVTIWLVRRMARVKYASILNLLAEREVVPELLQQGATPENLCAALEKILTEGGAAAQRAAFTNYLPLLRPPEGLPSDAAAEAVLSLIKQPSDHHPGA
jgi:lipid-A-disaccharide synthase